MNELKFIKVINNFYFNHDLRKINICIWTGYNSSPEYVDGWLSVDCYTSTGKLLQKASDYLIDLYRDISDVENVHENSIDELIEEQQNLYLKIKKWLEGYNIVVNKTESNV